MRTRTICVLILLGFSAFSAERESATNSWVEVSSRDLRILVSSETRQLPVKSDEQVVYAFHSISNELVMLFPIADYFCFVGMVDSNNTAVGKTPLGESLGKNFFTLSNFAEDAVRKRKGRPREYDRKYLHVERASAEFLFRPDELFVMSNAGNYTLKIRFQAFVRPVSGTNTFKLVRVPLVEVPVVKH